jgi:hypothetical protein
MTRRLCIPCALVVAGTVAFWCGVAWAVFA